MKSFWFRKKNINEVRDSTKGGLKKVLGAFDLLAMGVGTIMGVGIFVLAGVQAATNSGPAVMLSLTLSGIAAIFIALVFTEVASAIPSSGGSYAYTYASLGEVPAFLTGWMYLIYVASAAPAVAVGWSGYFTGILEQLHITIPAILCKSPFEGGIINMPAALICLLMSAILIRGIKESATLNLVLVFVKVFAVLVFLGIAFPHFKLENWSNFMPFGFKGVTISAGVLFFAYNGFDSVANAAEECKNPTRDITIGLIGSVVACAIIYIAIGGMLTGIVPYTQLNTPEALAYALRVNGSNIGGALVAAGGIAGITTVILFQLYSQTRMLMAMSRDKFLPPVFSIIHKKCCTPYVGTIIAGMIAALVAGLFPISILGNITSFAALAVMAVVSIAAMWLRKTKPTLHRPFKCPCISVVGSLAVLCCLYLMSGLVESSLVITLVLLAVGAAVYFLYSKKRLDKHFASSKR